MKNLALTIFILLSLTSVAQNTNSKLTNSKVETDTISNLSDNKKNYNSGNVGTPKREKYSNSYYGIGNKSDSGLNDRSLVNQVAVKANCND